MGVLWTFIIFKAKNGDDFLCVRMLCGLNHALNATLEKNCAFFLDLVAAAFLGCLKRKIKNLGSNHGFVYRKTFGRATLLPV